MRAFVKARRLTSRIGRLRRRAGLHPSNLNPRTLTLQQVEAHAASLHVTPESLLIKEPVG